MHHKQAYRLQGSEGCQEQTLKNYAIMTINQFKTFALETMCEEHLWKPGEATTFTLRGWGYKIEKGRDNLFHLYCNGSKKEGEWSRHDAFPTTNKLFHHIFLMRCISY